MRTTAKRLTALCMMVVMLACAAGISAVSALGAANGIYLATATAHYRHPVTGVIEDAGGEDSEVIGQSMTESATHPVALVEVDPAGNTFATIRLMILDSIDRVEFAVDGAPVSSTVMQQDAANYTADFRMPVNSEDSIIRCSMYVSAMGRPVVYFITLSGLYEGSGDFVTSVEVAAPEVPSAPDPEPEEPSAAPAESVPEQASSAPAEEPAASSEEAAPAVTPSPTPAAPTPSPTPTPVPSATVKPSARPEEKEEIWGLQEFDENGNKVSQTVHPAEKESPTKYFVLAAVLVAFAGFIVGYMLYNRRKS